MSEEGPLMTNAEAAPVLQLSGIGKEFGAIRALHDVDMQVFPGEVVGLMGDNGAGKSTLVKIIAGNFRPSHGEIRFAGSAVHFNRPIDARTVGIEVVYQDLARAPIARWSSNAIGPNLRFSSRPRNTLAAAVRLSASARS